MKLYNVGILGATGAVGQEMMKILLERKFPVGELRPIASARSAGSEIDFGGRKCTIVEASDDAFEGLDIDIQALQVDVFGFGLVANGSLYRVGFAFATIQNPHQHAHVVAKARPDEVAFIVGAEPVDVEDLRSFVAQLFAHVKPVLEVIAHMVTAERQHCHGVTADNANSARSSRSGLRSHDRAYEYAMLPVSCLVNQRSSFRAATAKDDCGDRHALRIV